MWIGVRAVRGKGAGADGWGGGSGGLEDREPGGLIGVGVLGGLSGGGGVDRGQGSQGTGNEGGWMESPGGAVRGRGSWEGVLRGQGAGGLNGSGVLRGAVRV